ncbi:MAG: hypothetical protein EKK54_04365 [Neisseriaceae bacterium]|nr:MAG: hypothetical protein EKK54_04365 [Neisseriaceae bacterium]
MSKNNLHELIQNIANESTQEIINTLQVDISDNVMQLNERQTLTIDKLLNDSLTQLSEKITEQTREIVIRAIPDIKPQLSNNNNDMAKIFVEVSKVLQKSAKEMQEQSSYMNNMSHEISYSISRLKKVFSFKSIFINSIVTCFIAGVATYFVSSYVMNNITKIQQYQQEHDAIQNLKIIKNSLDANGKQCWKQIFGTYP